MAQAIELGQLPQPLPEHIQQAAELAAHLHGLFYCFVAPLLLLGEHIDKLLQVGPGLSLTAPDKLPIYEHHAQVVDAVQHMHSPIALQTEWQCLAAALFQAEMLTFAETARTVLYQSQQD